MKSTKRMKVAELREMVQHRISLRAALEDLQRKIEKHCHHPKSHVIDRDNWISPLEMTTSRYCTICFKTLMER